MSPRRGKVKSVSGGRLYWIVFVAAFLIVAVWETLRPHRQLIVPAGTRWRDHAMLFAVSVVLQTLAIRLLPAGVAALVQDSPFGILNRPELPLSIRWLATVLIMDLLQYAVHRAYHSRALWRVHEVHHSDEDFDVSLGARFHPLEILPVQVVHAAAALILAPPPAAVLATQLLSVTLNFVAHANATFPGKVESVLRTVFVTPDLHRIHHSADPADHSRNFGQIFSVWDRLFGTYAAHSASRQLRTGVEGLQGSAVSLMLARPFRSDK